MQKNAIVKNKALRARDAAALLGISVSTLWRWTKEGKFNAKKLGPRTTVWSQEEIESFFENASLIENASSNG